MSDTRKSVLKKLRPPYAQPVRVVYGFSRTEPTNYGLTLAVGAGQALVAAGDGNVDTISLLGAKWRNNVGATRSQAVRIDHGHGIKTWIHGLGQVAAGRGAISRGALVGYAGQDEVFFAFEFEGQLVDPTHINRHFGLMDGMLGYTKAVKVHQAPDLLTTAVTLIQSLLWQGIRYFIPPVPVPVRFNLDFNGQGSKSGEAKIGEYDDVWHVIPALDFAPLGTCGYGYYGYGYGYGYSYGYGYCCGGSIFPDAQGFFLNDFRGSATKVYFERGLLTAAAGVSAFFDPMLSAWVGGYSGITPRINSFTIRNLPAGTYDLYVYSNGGTTSDSSTFYCSVNGGMPAIKTATPTVLADWSEDENYVKFDSLSVPAKGAITLSVYGYLAGLQLARQ